MPAKSNAKLFEAQLQKFRGIIGEEIDIGLAQLGKRWERNMAKRLAANSTEGGFRKSGSQGTGTKTGRLANSMKSIPFGEGPQIEGKGIAFGSRTPGEFNYARIQELGTVGKGGKLPDIKPRKSKFLAIPLPDAYKYGGGISASQAPPTNSDKFKDTFVQRNPRSGKLFILQPNGDGFDFLFLLVRSVSLAPRLGMVDTMRDVLKNHRRKALVSAFERAAGKAFGATKGGGA